MKYSNKLADNINSSDAHIAMNSIDVLESILISDSHQDIISKYVGNNYEVLMEVLRTLIGKPIIPFFYL
jgi:hypothetical protein